MNYSLKNTLACAQEFDRQDPLSVFRSEFYIPLIDGKEVLYFCGNSLGLQPKGVKKSVVQDLDDWAKWGVEGHFHAQTPWFSYHEFLREPMALITGCYPDEVVVMNSLTTNLHLMMISFYRPTAERFKIICEAGAFPSDQYALASQAKMHGFSPAEAVIELFPREGEITLRTEDILMSIREHGSQLALVMMGGVNYYSGQLFNMEAITGLTHEVGAFAGFDLAHAAGNVKLNLHSWDVDFAVWCSYKYLNGGPGGVAGAFVHRKHAGNENLLRLAGWWGNDPKTRFSMPHDFVPARSADSWQLSNAPVLPMAALRPSLELFKRAGMENLVNKSHKLTAYMEYVITEAIRQNRPTSDIEIITPTDPNQRGCQLSVRFKQHGKKVFDLLTAAGVLGDWRSPDVIRFAPVPLYNSFEDVWRCGQELDQVLKEA